MDAPPLNPQYSQEQLAQLAIAHFEAEGYPAWLAYALVKAGVFAMNNETALATTNDILMAVQMLDGMGEAEAAAEGLTEADVLAGAKSALGKGPGATPGMPLTPAQLAGLQNNLDASLANAAKALENPNLANAANQYNKAVARVEEILGIVKSGVGAPRN